MGSLRRAATRLPARLTYWLRLAVSLILVGLLLRAYGGEELVSAVAAIGVPTLLVVFVVNLVASMVIPAMVARGAMGTGSGLTLSRLIKVNLAVKFYALVLPRGVSVGVRWAKYRRPIGGRGAAGLVAAVLLFDVLGAAVLASLALIYEVDELPDLGVGLLAAGVVGALLVGAAVFVLLGASDRASTTWLARWMSKYIEFERGGPFTHAPARVVLLIIMTLVSQVLLVWAAWFVSRDMGIDLSFLAMMWMRSLISIAGMIPFTIAGLGVREAGYVAFGSLYGVEPQQALALAFVLLAVQLLIGLLGAGVEVWDSARSTLARRRGQPSQHESNDAESMHGFRTEPRPTTTMTPDSPREQG